MKFELKEYQETAASEVLDRLAWGSKSRVDADLYAAVSLSAPTGAGKTVIAAAVIERVLYGDPDSGAAGDPDAVFLWLTDDPSLNAQTRKKILEASDRIQPSQLVTLDETFDQPELSGGHVYFLNIQKLGKNSSLVRKSQANPPRKYPIWESLTATIKAHQGNYYLVIDEAHRGTGTRYSERPTIAQKLIHGSEGQVPPAPVVWGISATPKRFEDQVRGASPERVLRTVKVPVEDVRDSGLIKDVLAISYQGEKQTMEGTLVQQAAAQLKAMDEAWNAYTNGEEAPPVRPALVIQIPPNVKDTDVEVWLDACVTEWDVLQGAAVAHSLQEHTVQEFGKHQVRYIAPQDIQDNPNVRVVLFKEALTTGWDCPRAEVMVSLRSAKDTTYIAQLIGRMVRQPLARRIESDETLNRVRLYLPHFDHNAVLEVKTTLEKDPEGPPSRIEIGSVDAPRNPNVPAELFGLLEGLTSYVVPGPVHRSQVARLHKLAALLVGDNLLTDAISEADKFLVGVVNGERSRLDTDGTLPSLVADAETVDVEVMSVKTHSKEDGETVVEQYATSEQDVARLFAAAKRRFRDGLADHYWGTLITDEDYGSYDAKILTYALARESSVVEKVEAEAADRVRQWLDTYGNQIAALSEDRKARYSEVRAMAKDPETTHPGLPTGPISMPGDRAVPTYPLHLYADANGDFRTKLGTWEQHALQVETNREGFVGWYRNPTGGQRCLRIPYETGSGYGKLHPDFVVFHQDDNGNVKPSIIDPHGQHLEDAAPKLRGLAAYAAKHGGEYARIVAVILDGSGEYRMLDLTDPTIQTEVAKVKNRDHIETLFNSQGAVYA